MVELKIKLPEHFLDEEVRLDYTVTKKMKEVWAVELDLLAEFDRVCKKYDIKYVADSGTLLGAIRHKGFIPWDDDIDVGMLRSEYERLCEIAPLEFKEPYFFQTEKTDPTSARGHAQLRNSNTTGILLSEIEVKRPFNQGIFIDIFPFDNVPDDMNEYKKFKAEIGEKRDLYAKIIFNYNYFYYPIRKEKDGSIKWDIEIKRHLRNLEYLLIRPNYKKVYDDYENTMKRYDDKETKMINLLCLGIASGTLPMSREYFDGTFECDFEFLKIPVSKNYDMYLRLSYGNNYMTPLKTPTAHRGVFFDTDKPYTTHFKGNRFYE